MNKKFILGIFMLFIIGVLAACGGTNETAPNDNVTDDTVEEVEQSEPVDDEDADAMEDMDPSSSGEVPDDLKDAEDPTYPVGDEATINADHMKGMDGAVATIDGAYDTTVYEVTYSPTDGGEKVENHKWVIHEEIENAQAEPYDEGDEVVLEADHMAGMEGATATIDKAENTTVYMVSYTDTETDEQVTSHKWVVEDELSSPE